MVNHKHFRAIILPMCLMVLLSESCVSIQKMRYTRGLHFDFTSIGKSYQTAESPKQANLAKKNKIQKLVNSKDSSFIGSVNCIEKTTITESKEEVLIGQNKGSKSRHNVSNYNNKSAPLYFNAFNDTPVNSSSSLQQFSIQTDEIIYSEGKLNRGKIMLLSLLSNILAAIALFTLIWVISGGSGLFLILGLLFAAGGVMAARYGFEESQYHSDSFQLLFMICSFPGLLINVSILLMILLTGGTLKIN